VRLRSLPPPARLGVFLFCLFLPGFYAAAQATLWVRDGGGTLPGPQVVLWKYHGKPHSTKLDQVLDLSRPHDAPRAMWPYLSAESGWEKVAPIFTGYVTCGQCHVRGGQRQDLPFETYEQVKVVTEPDRGMPWPSLLVSAHNHAFAFSVLALIVALGVAGTAARRGLKFLIVLGVFSGAVLDVGGWFLTKGDSSGPVSSPACSWCSTSSSSAGGSPGGIRAREGLPAAMALQPASEAASPWGGESSAPPVQ
jgi:hypothetical protein